MLKDFKAFAMKGNVIDLAVGVVIGGAFGKIVSSLVNDLIMPIVGNLIGNVDFTDLFYSLDGTKYVSLAAAQEAGAATINYGLFINTVIEFVIIAFSIFLVIRQLAKLKKKEEVVEEVTTKKCEFCFTEIPIEATRCPHCTSVLEG
ncbi:MAG: large-conductance mechanosensitive channel protein MscL [Tissierellia bacterium]|jgi:large conductance mechanosensitive channel|nr:large-conductance mechanosensitive channel protein MscL [Tissierellia bacterium]